MYMELHDSIPYIIYTLHWKKPFGLAKISNDGEEEKHAFAQLVEISGRDIRLSESLYIHLDNLLKHIQMNIEHYPERKRFQTVVDGITAYVTYTIEADALDIRHTIVPMEIEGRGIASALVRTAYDYARSQGLKPVATCSYAAVWLKRHPEYGGTESKDFGGTDSCAL